MTKNLLDSSESKRPSVLDDRTGQYTSEPRLDLAETLKFVYEVHAKIAVSEPKIHQYAVHFAVRAMCEHMGWTPYEIATAEQYVTMLANPNADVSAG